ncbi:MAG TPA: hypothetical protein VIJ20_00825 [Solirubrobacteraceae bacterium]
MDEDAKGKPGRLRLYEELEAQSARASEEIVSGSGFTTLLARAAENAAALTKLSGDAMDLVLRNLRVAGRRDVVSLARQLARTEDKLERVLQEVEELRDELTREAPRSQSTPKAKPTRAARTPAANKAPTQKRPPARRRKGAS